jgi:magnesium-transporting ATPase (P-type)
MNVLFVPPRAQPSEAHKYHLPLLILEDRNHRISAYSLSVLTLDGVKYGDAQQTMAGIVIAAFFLFISWAKPLDKLSPERPHSSVFSPYMLLSIACQFSIHLYVLMSTVALARPFTVLDEEMRVRCPWFG